MNNPTQTVRNAIQNTKSHLGDYFRATVAQRAGISRTRRGSFYPDMTPEKLAELLETVEWQEFSHPAIMSGCKGYITSDPGLHGLLGVVPLDKLPPGTRVTLEDPKGTKEITGTVDGSVRETVNYTVLITGPEDGIVGDVVYTFHPGDPGRYQGIKADGLVGKVVTPSEALAMGLFSVEIRLPTEG